MSTRGVLTALGLAGLLGLPGCSGCEAGSGPAPSPSARPAAPSPAPALPPTPRRPAIFSSTDGAALAGELLRPDDLSAPGILLIHRLGGDRNEWKPLFDRLAQASKRYSVLAFDLRGRGASKPPESSKAAPVPGDFLHDVRAGIAELVKSSGGKMRGIVLVGSSFGAALAAKLAGEEPKVIALGLVSPGAAIQGFDIYRPYAEVRFLPTFVAGAAGDTVTREPLQALGKMAQSGEAKSYGGSRHSAAYLAEEHPELWQDLENWLVTAGWQAVVQPRTRTESPKAEPAAGAPVAKSSPARAAAAKAVGPSARKAPAANETAPKRGGSR